jgi:transcriptional regulator with XRE-family HTH domain
VLFAVACDAITFSDRDPRGERPRVMLRELREAHGWTQRQLAGCVNVAESTVYSWENGRTRPTRAHLAELATVLGVEPRELVGEASA